MKGLKRVGYPMGACAIVAVLSGCGGSVPPPAASSAAMRSQISSAPGVMVDKGLYATVLNGGKVYGYPIDNSRNKPPFCTVDGVRPSDVAVDGKGNLIVPSENGYTGTVTVFKGPSMCGPKLGSVTNPYGRPTDAAAGADATTGTFIVGSFNGPGGDNPGSVAVCTLKGGCTSTLSNPMAQYVGAVALARNRDCWASAETVGYNAILIYHRGCGKKGVPAKHFLNHSLGGLDIDSQGHLVAISSTDAKLYVYSGCNPDCSLVGGPFALRGSPQFGHLNESSTRLAVGSGSPAEVDVYAYSPTHVRLLYSFNKGLGIGSYAAAAYNPRSKE
ncbi:MAG TPA: hypothetical protein VFE35_02605 [Candidatus Cybelea sp.]|jgi:hypothetical protein|nr:hypothetical protein [Candidatus Cybelea sp.]